MSNRRLFTILASVVGITAVAILILVLIPKSTVVEFRLLMEESIFDVRAPRGPDSSTTLFSGEVKVQSLEVRGFERLDVARPNGEIVSASFPAGSEAKVQLRRPVLFGPEMRLGSAARVGVFPAGRDRVLVRIESDGAGDFGWQCRIVESGTMGLRVVGASAATVDFRRAFPENEWTEVAGSPPVLIAGGRGEANLGLHLQSGRNAPATQLRVVDLQSGEISSDHELPLALSQRELVAVDGERVVVLTASEPRETSVLLFDPNLAVTTPRFFTLVGTQADSHLAGGQIRFPAGERATIDLEPDFLLEVAHRDALTLKSMRVVGAQLELVLWGVPSSIHLGPTAGLMEEVLPNCFVWLYNHRLGTLAFSLLVWMVGATIAALKLFGWVKS